MTKYFLVNVMIIVYVSPREKYNSNHLQLCVPQWDRVDVSCLHCDRVLLRVLFSNVDDVG